MDLKGFDGGGALGRREKFDLKDEQKVLTAAHLGDRREGGLPHDQPWDFSPTSFSLAAPVCAFTGDTPPAVQNCTPK